MPALARCAGRPPPPARAPNVPTMPVTVPSRPSSGRLAVRAWIRPKPRDSCSASLIAR